MLQNLQLLRCFFRNYSKKPIFGRTQNTSLKTVTNRMRIQLLNDSRFSKTTIASRIQVNIGNSKNTCATIIDDSNDDDKFAGSLVALLKTGSDIHNWRHVEQLACDKIHRINIDDLLIISDVLYQVSLFKSIFKNLNSYEYNFELYS